LSHFHDFVDILQKNFYSETADVRVTFIQENHFFIYAGKSLKYCLGSYLRLKDLVFTRGPPYDPQPLETFLKETVGEQTLMSEFKVPRVLLTSVIANRWPTELYLFRNYDGPTTERVKDEAEWLPWNSRKNVYVAIIVD
jgi:hypothetical protein